MYISLPEAIKKYDLKIKGVVHVGGHFGEEMPIYLQCGIKNVVFIEPCKPAFNMLKRKTAGRAILFNCALGAFTGTAVMNVETANTGQSNSLLKPAKHLQQFPTITFDKTEMVEVRTMDSLEIQRENYNMLNLDVQGFEYEVLKGGTETLKHIDIIYTEVNRDEVYENCARVEQLDTFLKDFERVETNWAGGTWGDAIYLRKKPVSDVIQFNQHNFKGVPPAGFHGHAEVEPVPQQFRPHIRHAYPPDNDLIFEEWFYQNFKGSVGRTYLPIFWTAYYVNHGYGRDKKAISELQTFLNKLDKSKKYFTICQYDDGILNEIRHLDIKVFGMSGSPIDYPLPLLCKPHKVQFGIIKDLTANFIGRVTHPVRTKMLSVIKHNREFYISEKTHHLQDYCRIIARSVFTLCPRGYGQTSFRILEALQYGSIPVYISDSHILPHNIPFYTYGVQVKESEIENIFEILKSISPVEIKNKQKAIKEVYEKYFTYEGCREVIFRNLIADK